MVGHQVHHHAKAALVGLGDEVVGVGQSTVRRVNGAVVSYVVPVILLRRLVEGGQPNRINAQRLHVVEAFGNTAQSPEWPAVRGERPRIDLVDNCRTPPRPRRGQVKDVLSQAFSRYVVYFADDVDLRTIKSARNFSGVRETDVPSIMAMRVVTAA